MAILRPDELRKLKGKELDKKLNELELELAKEKANISIGATVTSSGRINQIKKTIARIKSVKNEKGEIKKHG